MIQKIWKDLFNSFEAEGLSIASKEDVEQIVDMLIANKIDFQIFLSNLEYLLREGFWGTEKKHKPEPTKSISYFRSRGERPRKTPLWFLAGYPDVMHWLNEKGRKYIKSHNHGWDDWEIELFKLFGLNIEDNNIDENQIVNRRGELRPKYYQNLVIHYKKETGRKLEVAVDEGSDSDIYLGAEFLDMLGTENNLTFIAENTTKYYLELTKNYKNRFNNEASLLATAGILDTQFYIFGDQTIELQEIIDMAQKSVSSKEEALIDFIIELEKKLIKIDIPDLTISEIENVCMEQKESIIKAIQKTKEHYTTDPGFASDVATFMNSPKFKQYRIMLGIKNNNALFKKFETMHTVNYLTFAEDTTKFYLELIKNYKDRFNNESSMLATAGMLNTLFYIFMDQTIELQEIIDMAQKSVSSKEEALIDFIINLEEKLAEIEMSELGVSEERDVYINQKEKESIIKAIQRTKKDYISEPRFASDVADFMNSPKFRQYRKMLGIKNNNA